jgi:octaprenyl-diphosphate synthase
VGVVVPLSAAEAKEASLNPLLKLVAADMEKVNAQILQHAESHVDLIPQLAQHLIDSGGKRLRPMLTIASARMCGYAQGNYHVDLATAVEFMHTATLLHDDVVDESDLRRGRRTARLIWGNQASVLVGDYLLGQAFRIMVGTKSLEALAVLSDAASVIAEGEVMQLAAAHNTATTEDAYMKVINAKTAALFAAAEVGAIVAERNNAEREALESYGRNLGIAFQLVDDALDYSGKQAQLGKSVGDDFREGKITLPVVLSYRRGDDIEREFWKRVMEQGEQRDGDLEHAFKLMNQHNAIEDTIERARHYGAIARDALEIFPDSEHKSALVDAIGFSVARAH